MKALSIKQPWASLIAQGLKTIETRTWATSYRGLLAIHVSKNVDVVAYTYFDRGIWDFGQLKGKVTIEPLGVVIATCSLVDVIKYTHKEQFVLDSHKHKVPGHGYCQGLYSWILENIQPLDVPVHKRGMPGLFDVEVP